MSICVKEFFSHNNARSLSTQQPQINVEKCTTCSSHTAIPLTQEKVYFAPCCIEPFFRLQ